jgi:hypothetical protein
MKASESYPALQQKPYPPFRILPIIRRNFKEKVNPRIVL